MNKLSSFSFVPLFVSILFLFLSGFVFGPDNGSSYPESKIIINKNGFSDGLRTINQSPASNTTLINPTGDGGFENGSTFSENGWTVINSTIPTHNPFALGTLPVQYAGNRCAYTWDGEHTEIWKCRKMPTVSHIYKDFTIPVGDNTLDLQYYYNVGRAQSNSFDSELSVYLIPVDITPVAGELLPSIYRIGGPYDYTNSAWYNDKIILSGKSGTLRLVFSHSTDPYVSQYFYVEDPVAVDNIKLISKGPLMGSKTIQPGGDFETFKDAFDELNLVGVGSGGVTFNVQAGQTFNTTIPTSVQSIYKIDSKGSLANPIIFQKSGSGANPKLNIKGHSNSYTFGIFLSGANYITFDGIDINDDGSSADDWVDYGFYISRSSNITVKNCTMDLSKHNVVSIGVKSYGGDAGNNNNKFYNNTIQDAFNGYYFDGSVFVYDQNNEIGTDGSKGTSLLKDIGSFKTENVPVYFVYCNYQKGFKLFNTSMDNTNIPETYRDIYGFYCGLGPENTSEIYNNDIKKLTTTQGSANAKATGIEITAGAQHSIRNNTIHSLNSLKGAYGITINAPNSSINIFNNKIYDVYSGSGYSGYSKGLVVEAVNTANIYNNFIYDIKSEGNNFLGAIGLHIFGGTSVNAFYNTVFLNNESANASKESAALKIGGTFDVGVNTIDLRNNIFVNLTNVTNGTRAVAHYRTGDGTVNYSNTNNNLYYTGATGPKNLIYYAKTSSYEYSDRTLKDYKTRIATVDQNAVWEYPPFISTTGTMDLHLNPSTATQCESGGQRITSPIAITNDYDANIRYGETGYVGTGTAPDIGADEINGTKELNPPLIGDYTVGTGGSFSTIEGAITKLNQSGVGGPVRFLLKDNNYYIMSLIIDISRSSLPNADNPVTIKPNTGVSPAIYTMMPEQSILKLNGADFIIIDGSNTTDGITKDLTFNASGDAAIWMCSKSASDGATNNIVKNCNIKVSDLNPFLNYGIAIGSGTSTTGSAEFPNTNITIQNNTITGTSNSAIFQNGYPNPPYDQNITITGNIFGSALSKLGQRGLMLQNIDTFTVSGNTISGVFSDYTANTLSGIELGGKNLNGSIYRNSINDIKNTHTNGYAATAIYLNSTSSNSNTLIYNNIIYDIAGYGEQNIQNKRNGYGILINSGGGYNIYYNSVNLATNQTNINGKPACLFIGSNAALSGLDIRNNIFSIPATTGNPYAVICVPSNGVFSQLNYNDYFYSGSNLGNLNGANITSLSAWKTATGKDANSISSDPLFVSNSDLHINPNQISPVIGAATQITEITTDFDGVTRAIPEIGAYEWISSVLPPVSFSSTVSSNTQIDLNFTPNANNDNVIIVWNLSGTFTDPGGAPPAPGSSFAGGTLLYNGTTSPQNHSGLQALTTYYYKAFSYNGSLYSSGLTANARTVNNLPYFQSFDGDFPPSLWTLATTYGQGDNWSKSTASGEPYSGAGVMKYFTYTSLQAEPWAFTPGFHLINGNEYRISFWQKVGSSSKTEKLKVTAGNAQTVSSQTILIWDNSNLKNENYLYRTADYTCTSSGIYYFAFKCYSAAMQDWIFVDHVEIKLKPVASNSQPVSGTSPIAFTGTGATLQYTEAPGSPFTLNMDRISSFPGGTPPGSILNIANQYWAATVTTGTASGTYCISLDLTGVEGISQPSTLHLLKRDNTGTNWVDLGIPSEVIPGPPLLVKYCGLSGFSEFGLGGGIDNPLPVQLSSFTSNLDGRNVLLKWKTISEINNSGFEIERRTNNIEEWTKLTYINGAGNSNSVKTYSFTDFKLETGKYNYRLKQIDFNGNHTYYNLNNSVEVGIPQKYNLSQNYPNPYNPTTKIDYDLPFDSKVLITIYDITGREIKRLVNNEVIHAGYHTIVFNGGNISSGVYFYRMTAEGNGQNYMMTKKMILVR